MKAPEVVQPSSLDAVALRRLLDGENAIMREHVRASHDSTKASGGA